MNRFKALFVVSSLACAGTLGCAQGSSPADAGGDAGPDAGADAGIDAGPTAPAASWSYAWEAALFTRGLDVSCAPADADAGVEGCIALLRYRGELDEPDHPTDSSGSAYGAVRFIRTRNFRR